MPLQLKHYTMTSALGAGLKANKQALRDRRHGLQACHFQDIKLDSFIGRVAGVEDVQIHQTLAEYDCRNHQLAQLALQQDNFTESVAELSAYYDVTRIGVVMGTTTSGILSAEQAFQHRDAQGQLPENSNYQQTIHPASLADFVAEYLALKGVRYTIGTACSSSAMVFSSAYRLITNNICDAVIVGGVDSFCATTLCGFHSLGLLSPSLCTPCDMNRTGLNIGEGAAFAILQKPSSDNGIALMGFGESCDAHHVSSPHPQGEGAIKAMRSALMFANLQAKQIDYVNMHGTASEMNDKVEDLAIFEVFGGQIPCSSTKSWMGHTLGASGAIEAVICAFCLEDGFIPGTLQTEIVDDSFSSQIQLENINQPLNYVMSNSFGFGGNNCCLIFGKIAKASY